MSVGVQLETLIVKIVAEATVYDKVVDDVEKKMVNMAKKVEDLGKSLSLYVTAPLVTMGTIALTQFGNFEDGLVRVAGAANLTAQQLKEMEDSALRMSESLGMGASKIVGTYGALIRGGFTLQEVLNGAGESAAQLAEVGEISTQVASETVVKILKIFKKDGLTAAQAVDTLSSAADASVISIHDMILSLQMGGGIAATTGQTFEDFAATIALLGQMGLVGSDAGTSLKQFLIMLSKPQSIARLEAFGISASDAAGNIKPLRDIIADLHRVFGNMPTEEKLGALSKIFGSDAARAAANFADAGPQVFDDMIKGMNEAMTVSQKYGMLQETLSGKWRAFLAGFERFGIVVGSQLAPALEMLTGALSSVMAWFEGLDASTQQFIVYAGMAAAAVGPILMIVGKLPAILTMVATGFTVLKTVGMAFFGPLVSIVTTVVGALGGPLVVAIAAVAAAVAGLVYWVVGAEGLATAWETAKQATMDFFQTTMGFLANFSHNIQAIFTWIGDNWKTILMDIGQLIVLTVKNNLENVATMGRTIMRIFAAVWGWVAKQFEYIFSVQFVKDVWTGLTAAFEAFKSWLAMLWERFKTFVADAVIAVASIFTGGEFEESAGEAGEAEKSFMDKMKSDFEKGREGSLGDAIKDILKEEMGNIKLPGAGFNPSTKEGPDLKFDIAEDIGEAVEDANKPVVSAIKESGDEIGNIVVDEEEANKALFDAIKASQDEADKLREFQEAADKMNKEAQEEKDKALKETMKKTEEAMSKMPDALVEGSQEAANATLKAMFGHGKPDRDQIEKEQLAEQKKMREAMENVDKKLGDGALVIEAANFK